MVRHGIVAALILGVPGVSVAQTDTAGDSARHHYRAGLQDQTQRDLDAARRSYEEAIRLDPRLRSRSTGSGSSMGFRAAPLMRSRSSSARAKAIRDLFDAIYHLGATLWWTGDHERALDALRPPCACARTTRKRSITSVCR